MKNITLSIALMACTFSVAFSQKKEKEVKYEKLYYKNSTIETNEATIIVDDAVSTDGETKFKIKIINKTAGFLIYKPEESKFIIDGKEMKPKRGNWKMISPNDHGSLVVSLPGSGYNAVKNYSFVMDGIYKFSLSDSGTTAPDFKLPPSQNDFKAGNFAVSLVKADKETDKTVAKFKCTYTGNKIGLIIPSRISVKMPDGKEYANTKTGSAFSRSGPIMCKTGETESFTAVWERMLGDKTMDMQFAEMYIKWHATFIEVTPDKLKAENLTLEFDEVISNDRR